MRDRFSYGAERAGAHGAEAGASGAFLARIPPPDVMNAVKLDVNFPYDPDDRPYHFPWLPVASFNNMAQYFRSRGRRFAEEHRGARVVGAGAVRAGGVARGELGAGTACEPRVAGGIFVEDACVCLRAGIAVAAAVRVAGAGAGAGAISSRGDGTGGRTIMSIAGTWGYLETPGTMELFLRFYARALAGAGDKHCNT